MKYNFLVLITVFTLASSWSQTRFQFELDLGTGFQSAIKFNGEELNHTNTFAIRLGTNVQIPVYKVIYIEAGVFGKYNRGSNEIKTLGFKSNNLRLQIPIFVGVQINDKWKASLGASVENNRDFDKIDFQKEYNLRYDFLTKIIYQQSEQFHYVLYTNWSLTKVPDYYAISNPKNGIYIGVVYQLKKKSKSLRNEK